MAQIISGDQVTLINQNGLIIPAVSPNGDTSIPTWLVLLSGIAVADFTNLEKTEYTILIEPPVVDLVNRAVNNYGAPQSPGNQPFLNIEGEDGLLQLAPSAAVGSIFDPSIPVTQPNTPGALGGFDIRAWVPNAMPTTPPVIDQLTGLSFNHIFAGMLVGITARDSGGFPAGPITYRLPYSFTL
ncbi:MAG: hypothetical protein JO045_06160, partial [Mycobacterium sp.]|nr:hypothetical protein [Mycobacterium sp.]